MVRGQHAPYRLLSMAKYRGQAKSSMSYQDFKFEIPNTRFGCVMYFLGYCLFALLLFLFLEWW